MLASQRRLFELPDDVAYLDAAAWTPLPRSVREAGDVGVLTKSRPWLHSRDANAQWAERARVAAAALIGAKSDDVAIVGSVSHAMATAACNLAPASGGRILRVADEFPSLCFAFDQLAVARGLVVEEVPHPADGDWTAALLEAIARPGAPPLAVATLTPLHWTNGTLVDLDRIAEAVHAVGAILVVDATQAVGVLPVEVKRLRPDFLAFPTYKWTLGPYGVAFLYAAPHRQSGVPLESNLGNGAGRARGARRYDKGERNDPVTLPMAAIGMELIAGWGAEAIAARLRTMTDKLADDIMDIGLEVAPRTLRSPHILGARVPGGLPEDTAERLKSHGVFASVRGGGLRLSPHVWVEEADIARCLIALRAILAR